ncbi:hypothetical protein FSARC_5336 [Fusarium sarcochroum]|uniref:AB hydrolase-1 domain-containing protein n=1 Tax=Fusarium sarcochroum TaxID=1208366 RepID=A0A8H4U065_9HYPO|nr:hypothetical protein FSARC_5336 [Fusarium sarcochroum]
MSKPTIVFVPGAWHTAEIYASVVQNLKEDGEFSTVSLPLPSTGAEPPHESFNKDVETIRDCLKQLVETEEKEVVLVTHSYGGMPGNEAPVGLGKKSREGKGLKGGVIRLVFIMALAMPEGFSPVAGGAEYPTWMKIDADKGIITVGQEDAKSIFYNDLPADEADKWAKKIQHQSLGVYTSTTTYAAWRHIPSTFVLCKKDKTAITQEVVEFMIQTARKEEPSAFDVVEVREDAGHCVMISQPAWVADVVRRAAGQ